MKEFQLQPTNGRKSFGGKAIVREAFEVSTLFSYGTEVAQYNHQTNEMKVDAYHSTTTGTHINAFLEFYGFDKCTKKELETRYNLKV